MRLLLLALFSSLLSPAAAQTDSTRLSRQLDSLVCHRLPKGSEAGIFLYDLTDNKPLYAHRPDQLGHPASTLKLLTAITALAQPEADEPFRTEVWYRGILQGDTLRGDLYVVGGFDPEFDEEALDSLVKAVAQAPFRVVDGSIRGDVSLKDSLYWGNGWLWDDNPAAFQPYLSPLMLNKGVLTVTARPGAQRGDTAQLVCSPASTYYTVENRTRTHTPGAGRFGVTRNWLEGGNRVCVNGNVDGLRSGSINLAYSERFFMHTFAERLRKAGVVCTSEREYAFGEHCRDSLSVRLAVYETPVRAVMDRLMKKSDNLNAEAMLCRLGAQRTGKKHIQADDGLEAVRALIKELGHDPARYKLADGCGLSNYNFVSPRLLVDFLRYAYARTDVFRKLYRSLPTAGMDGTLKNRMKGTPAYRRVHAKTGSFTGVNCLAGYIETQQGHWIAFAIMNENVLSAREARRFQDKVCETAVVLCPETP